MTVSLVACGRRYTFAQRPWLMGIVNATPDSFSDGGVHATLEARVALARELLAAGADVIDVGGESGRTNLPPVEVAEEIERVVSADCAIPSLPMSAPRAAPRWW
jgi:dihydropteroate synthase